MLVLTLVFVIVLVMMMVVAIYYLLRQPAPLMQRPVFPDD
jgi:hypothetical protein